MIYLTAEQVLFIHARVIAETGGMHGIRDLSMLLSAVARPQATFDAQDLYHDLFSKAAALMESLTGNHPFLDGNKRTAITSAGVFLIANGYRLVADNDEVFSFTLNCAQGLLSLEEITAWLQSHCERLG